MSDTPRPGTAVAIFIASAPLISAAILLAAIAGGSALLAYLFADAGVLAEKIRTPRAMAEWAAAGITATAALVAAFRIHARGRTPLWRFVPLSLFAAWQALSIYNIRKVPLDKPAEQIFYGQSPECFLFILAASIPLAAIVFAVLRLHRAAFSGSVAAMAGLGIAASAIWLMQFFHWFEMNIGDWSIYFAAIGVVVGSSAYARRLLPAVPAK